MGQWLKRLSYLALVGFPLAVLGTRLGLFDFRVAFSGITYTVYLAVALVFLGLVVFFMQRKSNPDGAKAARWATIISLIPLLGIGTQLVTARSVPEIHNISTDMADPPVFTKIAEIRASTDNSLEYDQEKLASVQQKAYPAVKTLVTTMSKAEAHERALVVSEALGWELVYEDVLAGIVEATETTALWAFKDDVVIRIREHESGGTAVDLRSVSRVGRSDLGANAKRIEKFLTAFEQ